MYVDKAAVGRVARSPFIVDALCLSVVTSVITTAIALLFAIPMGYALSRYSFPGRVLADTIVDIPIVFPPLVAGLTLLIFFSQTGVGRWVEEDLGLKFVFEPKGIVLCQFVVSASFAIRSIKTAFDEVDRRLENVALTLGILGLPPIRLFLEALGVRILSPCKVFIHGFNHFPWPVRLKYRGMLVECTAEEVAVTFPDGNLVVVTAGSAPCIVDGGARQEPTA